MNQPVSAKLWNNPNFPSCYNFLFIAMRSYLKNWRKSLSFCAFCAGLALLQGCGTAYNATTTTTTPTTAAKRAFVVNQFSSTVDVLDSQNDVTTAGVLSGTTNANAIIVLPATKRSLVYSYTSGVEEIDDVAQNSLGAVNSFPAPTDAGGVVATPDGLFIYAAIPSLAEVIKMDLTVNGAETTVPATVPSPQFAGVRHLAITHNGNYILAFSDNNDTMTVINRTNSDAVFSPIPGFDRPYAALFSSDDSTAYVLNCGPECGGHQASIAVVNMTTSPPTLVHTFNVRAATVAVMDSTNLYVAGSNPGLAGGQLDVMNLSTFVVTPVATPISDGKHTTMALAANNKLYIGSVACSNSGGQCLSVYNTSSGAASVLSGNAAHPAVGDVTAITPIANRSVVYIIQNGTLVIYDSSTDAPQATQVFISGKVVDVKEVDN